MTLSELYVMLLIGGTVLLASIAAARAAHRIGLPSLLLFLCVGLVAGEDGLGLRFDDAQLARSTGRRRPRADPGRGRPDHTRWSDVRRLLAPAGVLATVGVAISVVVTAAGAHWLLGIDWRLALLIGAIVSSTDAAAVFAVLRALLLPRKVSVLVEAESGFNDAPTIILVLLFSTTGGVPGPLPVVGNLLLQLVVGGVLGVAIGWLGVAALRHIALPATGSATAGHGRFRRRRLRRRRSAGRQRHHRRLPLRARPRQRQAAPPRGHPLLLRGRRLAGPDRPVRHARAARRPDRTVLPLGVSGMRASIAFYRSLGFTRKMRATGEEVAFFETGGTVLGLFPWHLLAADAALPDQPRPSAFHGVAMAWNCNEDAEVDTCDGVRAVERRQAAEARAAHQLWRLLRLFRRSRRSRLGSGARAGLRGSRDGRVSIPTKHDPENCEAVSEKIMRKQELRLI